MNYHCNYYLLPQLSAFPIVYHPPSLSLRFGTHLFKVTSINSINGRFPPLFKAEEKGSRLRICAVDSNWANSSSALQKGVWEDPDDGSDDSDYEIEDGEVKENDFDCESDWEEEGKNSALVTTASTSSIIELATDSCNWNLVKEVEQLLGPEERAILQQNASPNLCKISSVKWRPLQTLALSGQIHFMDKLLEDGLDINNVDNVSFLRQIINVDNGLDINNVDNDGLTVLHKAIIGKKEDVISHLLRKGASPHVKDLDGASPLHYAVQVGAMQTVKLLIKYEVDVNVADNEGWTPLHIAVQSRNRDIAKFLLINGADKTRRTKDGMTPLDLSICYGKGFKSYDIAKLLKVVPANRDL